MRVLVVDDDPVSRLLLVTAVEALGHEAEEADDVDAGWERFDRDPPDVVITDRVMGDADGLDLCRRIRADGRSGYTYLVLVTALGTKDDVLAGMQAGADDYLVKPVEPFDLRVRLLAAERVSRVHQQLAASQAALRELNAELERIASTDALTGIGNRRRFDEDHAALHARAVRAGRPYAVALLDLDRFKDYNDALGHPAGDEALRRVATAVARTCREGDEVYRYGGEELVVLFHDESPAGAAIAADRLRRAVVDLGIAHPGGTVVTVSVGVAAGGETGASPQDVVRAADEALYRAKAAGRDRVETAPTGDG